MINEELYPYKSVEYTTLAADTDEELWDITTGKKFRLLSLKIINPEAADTVTVILKDDADAKESISVVKDTTLYVERDELMGIEFAGDVIKVRSTKIGTIIRIGGLEY